MVLEERLGASNLDTRALDKCQRARLLDADGDALIAIVYRRDASHKGSQSFNRLESGLVDFLYSQC